MLGLHFVPLLLPMGRNQSYYYYEWRINTRSTILLIIYINDLVNISSVLIMTLFADDTNLFLAGSNIEEICSIVNQELVKLSRRFKLNKLSLNIKKRTSWYLKNRMDNVIRPTKLLIERHAIVRVQMTKFLGILLNSSLTWTDHIKLINKKLTKLLVHSNMLETNCQLRLLDHSISL